MALARRFKVAHDEVFPFGAFLVSDVAPIYDFERSTRENKVQDLDKDSGLPMWSVDVLDADPEAPKKSKTVTVKFAAKVQPGRSHRCRAQSAWWSFRAESMMAPKSAPRSASTDKAA